MIRLLAPAKVNLGLEVLGRRDDGYHEIRTIYCAVSCFDRVSVVPAQQDQVDCDRSYAPAENLAARALDHARRSNPLLPPVSVGISKRIPSAAGLGGASSDAAAALIGLNHVASGTVDPGSLAEIALGIGSDVPFLLRGGLAVGGGRGEQLAPLAFRPLHMVLVVPDIDLPDKTTTLYSRLRPADFSAGDRIAELARIIATDSSGLPGALLENAFCRPLYDLLPEVQELAVKIRQATGRGAHLTGAGPAHYVPCSDMADALNVRRCLATRLSGTGTRLFAIRSVPRIPAVELPDE